MRRTKRILAIVLLMLMIVPMIGIESFARTANIVYDSNNGTGETQTTTVAEGDTYGEGITAPEKEGMTFMGWATSPENASKGVLAASYVESEEATGALPRATAGDTIRLYAAYSYTVTLNCGNQGWQNANITLYKYEGTDLALYHTKTTVQKNYYMLPGTSGNLNDQRSFIEWNTAQNAVGKGTGTAYTSVYTANANATLKAIWGYPIRYNADGGIFPSNGTSIFQKYVCGYDGSNYENPLTLYGNFDFPEGTNTPTKDGCRLKKMTDGSVFYGLFTSAGTFFTTETAKQNLTIPPVTTSGLNWSNFHTTTTENGDLTVEFFAIWEPSVTYKGNGATGSDVTEWLTYELAGKKLYQYNDYTIMSSSKVAKKFSYSGATFKGWNTKADGTGTYYAPGSVINNLDSSDPIVLYAQWNVPTPTETYTISYDANGGTGAPSAQTKEKDKSVSISATTPSRTGYVFMGWSTINTGTAVFYHPGDTYSANSDVTLYAVWEAEKTEYTITFDANGGSGAPSAMTKTKGTAISIPAVIPTRTDYEFLGWSTNKNATDAEYSFLSKFETDADTTLYAVWQLTATDGYVITYDANGGTNAPIAENVTKGSEYTVTSQTPTYVTSETAYNFIGWSTTKDGAVVYGVNDKFTPTSNVTLYAKWLKSIHGVMRSFLTTSTVFIYASPSSSATLSGVVATNNIFNTIQYSGNFGYGNNSYSSINGWYDMTKNCKEVIGIILDTDGGTFSGTKTFIRTLNDGMSFTLPTEAPVRGTDTFLGWSADPLATVPTYEPGDIYDGTVYVTLYAIYKEDESSLQITFNSDGGTYITPIRGSGTVVLPTTKPAKSGYAFVGWSTDNGATYYKAGESYNLTKNVTMKAIYTKGCFVYYSSNGGSWGTTQETLIPSPTQYGVLNDYDLYYWPAETATLHRDGYRMHTSKSYLNIPRYYTGDGKGNGINAVAGYNNYYGYDLWPYNSSELSGGGHDANYFGQSALGLQPGTEIIFYPAWDPIITYNMNYKGGAVVQDFNYITEGNSYTVLGLGGSTMYAQNQASTNLEGYTGLTKIPKRSGYTFKDWNTKADGSGTTYKAGSSYDITEPITLYAMWSGHTHKYSLTSTVNATCTTAGYKEYTCSSCGNTYQEPIAKLEHNYSKVVTAPTCTTNGYTTNTCTMCKTSYTSDETAALNHDYKPTVTPATCTEGGYTTYNCSRCTSGYVADETAPLNHDYQPTVTPPTCTEDGYTTYQCSRCTSNYVSDRVPAAHDMYEEIFEPTCTEGGYTEHCCLNCNYSYKTDETNPKGHSFGDWYTTKEPTYTEVGTKRRNCSVCVYYEEDVLPKKEQPQVGIEVYTENYFVVIEGAKGLSALRFVKGHYDTISEIKNATGVISYATANIEKMTDGDGRVCIPCPSEGEYTVWMRTTDGEFIYNAATSKFTPALSVNNLVVKIDNINSSIDRLMIAPEKCTTYKEVKDNLIFTATSAKLSGLHYLNYTVGSEYFDENGHVDITVCLKDLDGNYSFLHTEINVTVPSVSVNGLDVTLGNLDNIKCVRRLFGTCSSLAEVRTAENVVVYGTSEFKGLTEKKLHIPHSGDITLAVQYKNGFTKIINLTIVQKVSTFEQDGNTVTFGNLDDLYVVRYAKGTYTKSNAIKNAPGSQIIRSSSIVNGKIVVSGLEKGVYTFLVQYNDQSQNFYQVTVD